MEQPSKAITCSFFAPLGSFRKDGAEFELRDSRNLRSKIILIIRVEWVFQRILNVTSFGSFFLFTVGVEASA